MTGRQRLLNILNKRPVDRISWTTLVDATTRSEMPEKFQKMSAMDFYEHIGCDMMQFGNYGLPAELAVKSPCRLVTTCVELTVEQNNGDQIVRRKTPWGVLTAVSRNGHSIHYPVQTAKDLQILTQIYRHSSFEPKEHYQESFERLNRHIGDRGLYVHTLNSSPIQALLQSEMGLIHFYYLLQDDPQAMEELFTAMHRVRVQEYELVASRIPAQAVISVENTSTTMISPELYRRYSLPQLKDFVRIMHAHQKKAILHMCGHVKDLLPQVRETGADGWHAACEPPIGNTPFNLILDELGEDFVLFGAVFPGEIFCHPQVSLDAIRKTLDQIFTPRIRKSNFLLAVPADGLSIPLERFTAVSKWMETNGNL